MKNLNYIHRGNDSYGIEDEINMYDNKNMLLNEKLRKMKLNDILYENLSSSDSEDSDECFSSFDRFLRMNTMSN
jgi:hypothetical protein